MNHSALPLYQTDIGENMEILAAFRENALATGWTINIPIEIGEYRELYTPLELSSLLACCRQVFNG